MLLFSPEIELVWISRHDWRAGRALRVEAADRWVFWQVRSGVLEADLEGKTWTVGAGHVCLQKPNLPRHLRAQTDACWDSVGFRLRPHPLHNRLASATISSLDTAEQTLIDATLFALKQWHLSAMPDAPRSSSAALQLLLSLCIRQAPVQMSGGESSWLHLALARLEESPRCDLALLSREVGYSPAQFRVRFQEHTGYSPRDYAAVCLDRQARRLLLETDASVEQIATQLGFSAPAHFIRFFKRLNATTPARFRCKGGL